MCEQESRRHNIRQVIVVAATLNDQNGQAGISVANPRGNDAPSRATYKSPLGWFLNCILEITPTSCNDDIDFTNVGGEFCVQRHRQDYGRILCRVLCKGEYLVEGERRLSKEWVSRKPS